MAAAGPRGLDQQADHLGDLARPTADVESRQRHRYMAPGRAVRSLASPLREVGETALDLVELGFDRRIEVCRARSQRSGRRARCRSRRSPRDAGARRSQADLPRARLPGPGAPARAESPGLPAFRAPPSPVRAAPPGRWRARGAGCAGRCRWPAAPGRRSASRAAGTHRRPVRRPPAPAAFRPLLYGSGALRSASARPSRRPASRASRICPSRSRPAAGACRLGGGADGLLQRRAHRGPGRRRRCTACLSADDFRRHTAPPPRPSG